MDPKPKNGSYCVSTTHASTLRQAQSSAPTACEATTKLMKSPFALSSLRSGRHVEEVGTDQRPNVG